MTADPSQKPHNDPIEAEWALYQSDYPAWVAQESIKRVALMVDVLAEADPDVRRVLWNCTSPAVQVGMAECLAVRLAASDASEKARIWAACPDPVRAKLKELAALKARKA